MSPREAAGRDPRRSTLPLGAPALNVRRDKDRRAGCWHPQRRRRRVAAMATAAPPRPDARDIFGEVVESLVHERPLAETLALISRRVCELGAFDFCGILVPDAEGDHVPLPPPHPFPPRSAPPPSPPRYVTRLNDLFLGSLHDSALAAPPTASALRRRETAVLGDALSD